MSELSAASLVCIAAGGCIAFYMGRASVWVTDNEQGVARVVLFAGIAAVMVFAWVMFYVGVITIRATP